MSLMPRFCSSVSTASQNADPLVLGEPHAQQFLVSVERDTQRQLHRLVADTLVLLDFTHQAVEGDDRIDGFQRAALPTSAPPP